MRDGRICGIHMKSQIALHAAVGALCVFTAGREERYQKSWKAPPLAPWWLSGEELTGGAGYAGDPGLVPGSGRCSGGGNGNPLQYSCLKNPWTEELGRLQSMGSQRVRHD